MIRRRELEPRLASPLRDGGAVARAVARGVAARGWLGAAGGLVAAVALAVAGLAAGAAMAAVRAQANAAEVAGGAGAQAGGAVAAEERALPGLPPPGPPQPSPLIEVLRRPMLPRGGGQSAEMAMRSGAEAPLLLPEPPLAPPAPAALEGAGEPRVAGGGEQAGAVSRARPAQDDPLAGVESRPGGGYRLRVAASAAVEEGGGAPLDPAAARAAEAIGRRLAAEGAAGQAAAGRITVVAQVAAPAGTEVSVHRRLALARALAVKRALVAGGVDPTRIDLRPLGRTEEGADAVDILPPPPHAARRETAGRAQGGAGAGAGAAGRAVTR